MPQFQPTLNSLALYKIRPARVTAISDKIELELKKGKTKRVRPKDITILHPGPIKALAELTDQAGDVEEVWELLAGGETHLSELAELIYGDFTPSTAWSAWRLVEEGIYFEGKPETITVRSEEQIRAIRAEREAKVAAEVEWSAFLKRLSGPALEHGDRERLLEVERLALGRSGESRILQAMGRQEKPENAHCLLVSTGYWEPTFNPYPQRLDLLMDDPDIPVPLLLEEERLDLTHLPAFAIDDEGNEDPDDALSLDGSRIWVHVADVAALVAPGSELDLEARSRCANLYLPERIVNMLPPAITEQLGLGLQEVSPALSFGFRLDERGELVDLEIAPSRIRATRHSYGEIDGRLDEEPFATLHAITRRFRGRRMDDGAAAIELPEVSLRVKEGNVVIRPLERLGSRAMVAEAMLMAGVVAVGYALRHKIPLPFATQQAPNEPESPRGMAAMYAYRRRLKPGQTRTLEERHAGLGLDHYARATSPLRRYLDLVLHQQLRAHLQGKEPLSVEEIAERIGSSGMAGGSIRRAERLSNLHWKLIHLSRHPEWRGKGVVVQSVGRRATLIIPELAMETRVRLESEVPLDTVLPLALREVNMPELVAWFRVVD